MSELFDGYNLALEVDRSDTSHSFLKRRIQPMTEENETDDNHFTLIFGEPALLKGECRTAYNLLRAHMTVLLKADDDVLSQLKVQEVTDSIWEARRYKRFATQHIDTGYLVALEVLLQPVCRLNLSMDPGRIALDYYHGEEKNRQAAQKIVRGAGITKDQIQAQAHLVNAGQFSCFDRLVDSRSATLKGLMKDHDRQQRKAEKQRAALARQREPARGTGNLSVAKKDAA
jgi:hypothetical protein